MSGVCFFQTPCLWILTVDLHDAPSKLCKVISNSDIKSPAHQFQHVSLYHYHHRAAIFGGFGWVALAILQPMTRLFNQGHCPLSSHRLHCLQRWGDFFARAEGQSSACSFPMSGRLYVESLPWFVNPLARLFNQACWFCPFAVLSYLQRRDGKCSPHARSVTPAGCFVLSGWHVCSTRRADFVRSLPTSPSQVRWQFFNSCWVCNTCI